MKATVISMQPSWSDYTIKEMEVEFYSEEYQSNEPVRVYAKFYKDGKIQRFPSLACVSNDPYYYIAGGKIMEKIIEFQGEKAKNLFEKASSVDKQYDDQIEAIYNSEEFKKAHDRNRELDREINELYNKSKRARREDKKEEYDALRYKLEEERKEIQESIIEPFEDKQRKLRAQSKKALREIVIEL